MDHHQQQQQAHTGITIPPPPPSQPQTTPTQTLRTVESPPDGTAPPQLSRPNSNSVVAKDLIPKMNLLLLGLDSTDAKKTPKTAILEHFKRDMGTKSKIEFVLTTARLKYQPSLTEPIMDTSCKTQIFDVPCNERHRGVSLSYFSTAHVQLYFYEPVINYQLTEADVIAYILQERENYAARTNNKDLQGRRYLSAPQSMQEQATIPTIPKQQSLLHCVELRDFFSQAKHHLITPVRILVMAYQQYDAFDTNKVMTPELLGLYEKLTFFWSKLYDFDGIMLFDNTEMMTTTKVNTPTDNNNNTNTTTNNTNTTTSNTNTTTNNNNTTTNTANAATPYLYDNMPTPPHMTLIQNSIEFYLQYHNPEANPPPQDKAAKKKKNDNNNPPDLDNPSLKDNNTPDNNNILRSQLDKQELIDFLAAITSGEDKKKKKKKTKSRRDASDDESSDDDDDDDASDRDDSDYYEEDDDHKKKKCQIM